MKDSKKTESTSAIIDKETFIKSTSILSEHDKMLHMHFGHLSDNNDSIMKPNIPYDVAILPIAGPSNPNNQQNSHKNILSGHVESIALNEFHFEEQRKSKSLITSEQSFKQIAKKKKEDSGSASDIDGYKGPWAGFENEVVGSDHLCGPKPEELAILEQQKAEKNIIKASKHSEYIQPGMEKSIFHGVSERDYRGRTYMHIPADVDVDLRRNPGEQDCFLPKRLVHTWTGHSKAVMAIRFLPNSAHLLLSCSMDAKVKIWDVYHSRKCLRTLIGHNKAVRDVVFSPDGKHILTASYDKTIKLWDTETGKCISRYNLRATPYCIVFHPEKPNIFLAGCANKRIYQWDTLKQEDEIVQEYNQHLDAVNSITFIDENRKIVTTSDDKTIRVWEWDIPVPIKTITEPHMHSIPSVSVHPNKEYLVAQSMDNQILTFSASDTIKSENKRFTGHLVAGYACQPGFSPDGQYIMSGDGEGKLWFWNWKTGKFIKNIKAHDKVTICCLWHPHETSKVATCSWDGTIKYWD